MPVFARLWPVMVSFRVSFTTEAVRSAIQATAGLHVNTTQVCILSGSRDDVVVCNPGVAKKVQKYYEKFINSANIKTVFDLKAGHTFVRS